MRLSQTVRPARAFVLSAALALGLAGTGGIALAQDQAPAAQDKAAAPAQPDPNTVVATVGDETVTEADLAFAAEDLAQDLQNVPPQGRRAFLTSVLIDMKVMAQAARKENMQDTDLFKRRQAYLVDRALRRAYFADKIASKVTKDEVQAAYDKMVKDFKPVEEVHARHILVKTEDEAKQVEADLKSGTPFEVEALNKSIDTGSGKNGGDLGYFQKGQMVPEFEEAAFSLDVGQVSDPVQSQFGWHIIKVEDKRMSSPPPFEQVAPQLQQKVLIEAFDDTMSDLKKNVKIDIKDPDLAKAMQDSQDAPTQ